MLKADLSVSKTESAGNGLTAGSALDDVESMRVSRGDMTLRERTADKIRQAIIENRIAPGTHLIERELCEMMGVSRTSVREALRHLESERLIETVPHRGPVVVSLTVKDALELYTVRAVLEGLVGELFARQASDEQIEELSRLAVEMDRVSRKRDPTTTLEVVAKFYRVLFEGANNSVCEQFIGSLTSRIAMFRRLSLDSDGRRDTMMAEVEQIVAAARARDPGALKQACINHVNGACSAVMKQLADDDSDA